MRDTHINNFYRDAGLVLQKLYRAFPRKIAIYVEDISGPDEPDEYGLHSSRYLACLSTMLWLGEQDYLSYESTIRQEAIDQAVLTHKGFTLLSAPHHFDPAAAPGNEPPESAIDALRRSLKSGNDEQTATVMGAILARAHHFH